MATQRETTARKRRSTKVLDESSAFLMNQYLALRDEIIKRMEIQNQIISLMLVASGALISYGYQADIPTVILATPILALFLASFWANHDVRVRHIGLYIRRYIEDRFLGMDEGWEGVGGTGGKKYLARNLSIFASQGIFVGIQLLSMIAALIKRRFNLEYQDQMLLGIDLVLVLITVRLMRRRRVVV